MAKTEIINWFKSNKLLVIILLLGAFLRLFKINEYLTFLGDEGRDAIIVRNLLVHFDPILIGPGTSVGGMYLGPLYYYFMAPFLFLSNYSPIGPAIGVALLGVVTIYLVYIVGKSWFGEVAGLMSSFLFAISPTIIIYSRSSWNPNIMPFFSLLAIYSIWKVWKEKKYSWLYITAVSLAFVLQSHYLGVLLIPVLAIYWFLSRVPFKYTLVSVLIFGFLMSPLLLFDIRHGWMNSKAFYKFVTVRQETVSIKPWTAIPKTYPIFEEINGSLLTAKDKSSSKLVTLITTLFVLYTLVFRKKSKLNSSYYLLLIWIGFGLLGFGLYKQHIYDHYFGFLFAGPILLTGLILQKLYNSKYKLPGLAIFVFLVYLNLSNSPIKSSPNNQMQRSQNVASKIIEESKGNNFNIAVIAERNYEDGYQYFLEKENSKVVEIDAQIKESITEQLFVICEVNGSNLTKETCNPTNSPKAEVANFGWSKIENSWEVDGVIIYKLVHNNTDTL